MKSCLLCKADYEEVKSRLTMHQVAERYGIEEDRKHLCTCPFHPDKHPSMRIYPNNKGFYCFACQKGGDIITFVSALYDITNQEACRKLIEDFDLPITMPGDTYRERREQEKRVRSYYEIQHFQSRAEKVLMTYWRMLCEATRWGNKISAADLSVEKAAEALAVDPHFVLAMQELDITEYRLQCLKENPGEFYADKKAVMSIERVRERITEWT